MEIEMSDDGSDVDAEGSVDDDYAEIHVATNGDAAMSDALSASSRTPSNDSRKRKARFDEEEHIRANPELYGIRRSVGKGPEISLGVTC